jgi:hypothetical protein
MYGKKPAVTGLAKASSKVKNPKAQAKLAANMARTKKK